jgi:Alw26I/Eco31I/Esp3I family type II restriction endonuclease
MAPGAAHCHKIAAEPEMPPREPEPRYGDSRRAWNEDFVSYMQTIVDNPAYAGMPCTRDDTGKIDWTIPSNRSRGSKNWDGNSQRRKWWEQTAISLGIPVEGHWLSRTAKAIHPFGKKPCQTCGRVMELAYVYPTRGTITAINRYLDDSQALAFEDLLTVEEVLDSLQDLLGTQEALRIAEAVFPDIGHPHSIQTAKEAVLDRYVSRESRKLSPGAMSNAPDRLDGFHTYNLCCRSAQDRGRAQSNLVTYAVDRRAYEQWSEGDWAVADLVMALAGNGRCLQCGDIGPLSADHIGPISLGFAHSPHFTPLCRRCNSAKNNRMSLEDVQALKRLEDSGEQVASWQIKALWAAIRDDITKQAEALLASKLLRILQHHYLQALHLAVTAEAPDLLLQYLHPEFAYYRIDLVGFNAATLTFQNILREPRQDSYATSRAARMMRIAFDALAHYGTREHRNIQIVPPELYSVERQQYVELLAERTRDMGPPMRTPLLKVLASDDPPEVRDESFASLVETRTDYSVDLELAASLERLLAAISGVLAVRFQRGEAVSWDDLADN